VPTTLLEMTDMRGRTVILTRETWYLKILIERPSAHEFFPEQIRAAVFRPTFANADREHANRRCHYLDLGLNARGKQRWLKVVIEYEGGANPRSHGFVVTLYRANRPKPGEVRDWP
jgi:hypothetical protein